jgi:hypothetical protein
MGDLAMKSLLLVLALALFVPAVHAADVVAPDALPAGETSAAPVSLEELFAELSTPAPEQKYTYITWNGGTCTAWLYCPGEPYWKCQSTVGDCDHDYCSITCNGNTRSCRNPGCIPF